MKKVIKEKKCKVCKNNYKPFSSLQQVCSKTCEIEYKTKIALKNLNEIKKNEQKSWKERKKNISIDVHSQKHKKTLQDEINKLSRMIDEHCGFKTCIDCGKTLIDIGQVDGSHFHNVKGNENIRYNLLNIHSSRSECNQFHGGNKEGYKLGLIQRYGHEGFDKINTGIREKYKTMKFSNKELFESIAIVRKIQRDLPTFANNNALELRELLNKIIGLYK